MDAPLISSAALEAIPVLAYAGPAEAGERSPLPVRVVNLIIALIGIAIIFLPFSWGVSPMRVLIDCLDNPPSWDMLILLAGPFYLAILILLVSVRVMFTDRAPAVEKVALWTCAATSAAASALVQMILFGPMIQSGRIIDPEPILIALSGLATLIVGTVVVWMLRRSPNRRHARLAAIYVAYLANGVMCLIGFQNSPDPGWYLTAVVAITMGIELAIMLRRRHHGASASGSANLQARVTA